MLTAFLETINTVSSPEKSLNKWISIYVKIRTKLVERLKVGHSPRARTSMVHCTAIWSHLESKTAKSDVFLPEILCQVCMSKYLVQKGSDEH